MEGDDPDKMHAKMAEVLEGCVLDIRAIQEKARSAPSRADRSSGRSGP